MQWVPKEHTFKVRHTLIQGTKRSRTYKRFNVRKVGVNKAYEDAKAFNEKGT